MSWADFEFLSYRLGSAILKSRAPKMDTDADSIQHLPIAEKLRLVQSIWNDIASSPDEIPIPAWVLEEAQRRRYERIANPEISVTHQAIWDRIRKARDALRFALSSQGQRGIPNYAREPSRQCFVGTRPNRPQGSSIRTNP